MKETSPNEQAALAAGMADLSRVWPGAHVEAVSEGLWLTPAGQDYVFVIYWHAAGDGPDQSWSSYYGDPVSLRRSAVEAMRLSMRRAASEIEETVAELRKLAEVQA